MPKKRVGELTTEQLEARHDSDRKRLVDNPERRREISRKAGRKWRANNLEKKLASCRRWQANNPERIRETQRRWGASAQGKASRAAYNHNRRIQLSGTRMTKHMVLDLRAEYGGLCPYCNAVIVKGCVDHIVPVTTGGKNERNNLVWICQTCNRQKHNKSLLQFMLYRRNLEGAPT